MYRKHFKRLMDIGLSALALVALSPILLATYLLVRTKLGTPVFFKQERVGKDNKIFTVYKFRSMTDAKDDKGDLLPAAERVTPFGRNLRSTSIDELPQLFNVLLGDMSIIGPRPLLPTFLDHYTDEQKRRHEVRPGLSTISVVTGRANQTWEEQFRKDVVYVDNLSFLLDCKIILKTIPVVLRRKGMGNLVMRPGGFFISSGEDEDTK